MELSYEPMNMDDYFRQPDFQEKKPNLRGDWMERCGDNFYSLKPDGTTWQQHRNRYHIGEDHLKKDTKHPIVFIASENNFWYFGRSAQDLPADLMPLTPVGKGIRTKHEPELVKRFCEWMRSTFPVGIHGLPHDNLDLDDEHYAFNNPMSPSSPPSHGRC